MTTALGFLLLGVLVLVALTVFLNANPASIVAFFRRFIPILLVGFGIILTIYGRPSIGMPMVIFGASWAYRQRSVGKISTGQAGQTSTVRSAWLEMQLDHDSGELEGLVLTGSHEGTMLSDLNEETLLELYESLAGDPESAGLMEAYLDRRIPLWREHAHGGSDRREAHSSGSGAMSKQEAYQILGLSEGASTSEIKTAHRKLMKVVHPDSGGSSFLAARINEAKDTLLN